MNTDPIPVRSQSPDPIPVRSRSPSPNNHHVGSHSPTPFPPMCPVCLGNFRPDSGRHPVNLNCEHIVCFTCVKELWIRSSSCPICRTDFAPKHFTELTCWRDNCPTVEEPRKHYMAKCGTFLCSFCIRISISFVQSQRGRPRVAFTCPDEDCPTRIINSHAKRLIF